MKLHYLHTSQMQWSIFVTGDVACEYDTIFAQFHSESNGWE